jgi:trimethylamine--corrinoid protein Co-methyltransferase
MMEPHGVSVWGGVELGLASAATVQVGHFYHLPVNVMIQHQRTCFRRTERFRTAINAMLPALAGADELSGIGEMEAGVMGSYAQMVIDDEIAGGIQRVCRGIKADKEALAVDVILEVMAEERNFLTQPHTVRFLRQGETMITRLAERGGWESWDRTGRQGMGERAQSEAVRILSTHEVPSLDFTQEQELDRLLAAALQTLQEKVS